MPPRSARRSRFPWLALVGIALPLGLLGAGPSSPAGSLLAWQPFGFFTQPGYGLVEQGGLIACLLISFIGLGYAFKIMKEVYAADTGTPAMQAVAQAIREGANAYLRRQFTVVGVLIVVISALIVLSKWPWHLTDVHHTKGELVVVAIGRGAAFLMGSLFSAAVGFTGMRLATAGNLRVAAASRISFGHALRMAYRTGIVTGMFTCGLGLLGGSLILLIFGETAYEVLLGFGFGGSLLALFMRVGGGIFTKAADVGADLVGKVEQSMPEDDPRNAATIADNVGDNVGDCAGMAADVFESYAVTMVAAVILGYASLGTMGMFFPLFVMAIGVIASLISTAMVGKGMVEGNATSAMKSINNGFYRSALISVAGFVAMGAIYLNFSKEYIVGVAIDRGMYKDTGFRAILGLPELKETPFQTEIKTKAIANAINYRGKKYEEWEHESENLRRDAMAAWNTLPKDRREQIAEGGIIPDWTNPAVRKAFEVPTALGVGIIKEDLMRYIAAAYTPLKPGLNMSAVWCCLIGIVLAIALNKCTEYWTSTDYQPVKDIVKASRTGHATNIISGLSLGYESAVWTSLIIASAILGSVMVFQDTGSLLFIAYGVALCGIGMLTLTGDTISMDVFGPVADNANGIGEMGFNRDGMTHLQPGDPHYIEEGELKVVRQRLADLDAVGNTTKAITKGVAIGSAVIAAVSLFASFIAVLVTGSEEKIGQLTIGDFIEGAAKLTVADPYVFIGMLIGGAVPMLFSAMTIRAVGRAAGLIVLECRNQFRDPEIKAGRRRPDYGRVVDICTGTAQKELIGPGLLAICTPLCVGFLLGPFALGGFLAGMIVVGQLLAVFMSNAGGGWDNAKKMIEDDKRPGHGKGSEHHKASVTGDTVGDPLKDTAGPAINPLIKVMNMVSLLALPMVIMHNVTDHKADQIGYIVLAVSTLAVVWAWWQSKRESKSMTEMEKALDEQDAAGS